VRQGVGTVTTAFGASNIARYLADGTPEFAVVMYGTNDQAYGDPVGQSMRNLTTIIDACTSAGTVPIVATIPPRGYNPRSQGGQERFNRSLIELARQKQVPVSYVFEAMIKEDLRTVLSDGIHLTPARGNDLAGQALRETMDQVYFALRDTASAR
jgi:lysophospholipase L1-like esterase